MRSAAERSGGGGAALLRRDGGGARRRNGVGGGATIALPQRPAEPLDAAAGFLKEGGGGGVADAEEGGQAKGLSEHHRHPLGLQKLDGEVGVGGDDPPAGRALADQGLARGKDIEGALRRGAAQARGLVEH